MTPNLTVREAYNKYISNKTDIDLIKSCSEFYIYYYIIKVLGDSTVKPYFDYKTKSIADFFEVYGIASSYKEMIHSITETWVDTNTFTEDNLSRYISEIVKDKKKVDKITECIFYRILYSSIPPYELICHLITCTQMNHAHLPRDKIIRTVYNYIVKEQGYPYMFLDKRWQKAFFSKMYVITPDDRISEKFGAFLAGFGDSTMEDLKKDLPKLADLFVSLDWNEAFGGDNWRRIALHTYRRGSTVYLNNDIIFVDFSWNIQHNTNMWCDFFFSAYDSDLDDVLIKILDYKREGKILEIFNTCNEYDIRLDPILYNYYRIVKVAPTRYPIRQREWRIAQRAYYRMVDLL